MLERTRLLRLALAVHVSLAVALSTLSFAAVAGPWPGMIFDALLAAEIGLLGLWAGFGHHSKMVGFLGVLTGLAYASVLQLARSWPEISATIAFDGWLVLWYLMFYLALAMMTLTMIVATAVAMRLRGVALTRDPYSKEVHEAEAVQFSTRQLMLLVCAVAVLVKLGPTFQTRLNDYRSSLAMLAAVLCWGICFGAVALAGLWASLQNRVTAARLAAATVLAASLSLLPPYYFPELLTSDFFGSAAIVVGAAWIIIGSLLIVRQSGYRLSSPSAATVAVAGHAPVD